MAELLEARVFTPIPAFLQIRLLIWGKVTFCRNCDGMPGIFLSTWYLDLVMLRCGERAFIRFGN
jgi:hypothetical protein